MEFNSEIDSWTPFKKSSASGLGNCVEVSFATSNGDVRVRDSKNSAGSQLQFTAAEWSAFVAGVRNGEFDRHDA